uniref:Carboxylesterase type B domain-containing protein n=1 Tax=Heliothis virescens TaxID=7102 RepID=A0A2A4JHL2_HELVI
MKHPILLLLLIECVLAGPRVDPLVHAPAGLIRGLRSDEGGYDMFLGVPYALVDEAHPFAAASPHPGFKEPYLAYHDDVICPQYIDNNATGTIQCLQLNVYVPTTATSLHTLPVMVFFPGGSFVKIQKTKDDYSPKFLIRHDVIIVTFNYRVGPYGFLCLSKPGYNNQGLKDQILALNWVKENIAAFGGDVDRITAFGQSAGSMSLDIHILNNEGFVNRVILQSGVAVSPWVVTEENDGFIFDIAKELGYNFDNVHEAIEVLYTKDPLEVIRVSNDLIYFGNKNPVTRPCVEKGDNTILKDFPINLKPKVKNLDIMLGHTNKEAKFVYADNSNPDYYKNYDFKDELSFVFREEVDSDVVRQFYIGDSPLSEELQSLILDYGSDIAFNYPAEQSVERYVKAGARSVCKYVFSYEGGRNRAKINKNFTADGASHGDDTSYLFDMKMFEGLQPSEEDQRIIDAMTTMWTNFAKYGDPTPLITDITPVRWRPSELSRRPYLSIDSELTVKSRVFHDRMAFWEIYYKLYEDKLKSNTSIKDLK